MIGRFFGTDERWSPLIVRVFLGAVFFPHGAQKALGWYGGHGFSGTMDFFGSMGMPAVAAALVIAGEFLGAIGLIVGLGTRLAAFGIGAIMTGAVVMVHHEFGFFMNWMGNQAGEGFEYHLLAIGMALSLLVTGSGKFSLDGLIARRLGAETEEGR